MINEAMGIKLSRGRRGFAAATIERQRIEWDLLFEIANEGLQGALEAEKAFNDMTKPRGRVVVEHRMWAAGAISDFDFLKLWALEIFEGPERALRLEKADACLAIAIDTFFVFHRGRQAA